ncbi:MAG: acetyltransferase [Clostridiales bacterium]|nr:acetyltransferase [Clostridiales bacterium]
MKRLNIIGASGHGKVVADIARLNGYDDIVFFDDNGSIKSCGGIKVAGNVGAALESNGDFFIAIGKSQIREHMMKRFEGRFFPSLVHPGAVVAGDVKIGEGSLVAAGAVVNPGASIGRGCIINTCASADHDCNVSDFVHIAVGAHLSGSVSVGQRTWICVGASVVNNITICADCVVGAGAVVIKDITEPGTYAGVPAKLLHGVG